MKFERTQGRASRRCAFDQMLKLEKDRREAIADKREGARGDVGNCAKGCNGRREWSVMDHDER
jgi:hypothetical protein